MRWGKPQSLYAQLLLFLGLPLVLLWGLSAFNSYVSALQAATQAYDRTLLSSARTVAERLVVRGGQLEVNVPWVVLDSFELNMNDRLYYKVLDPQGKVISGYDDLPAMPPSTSRTQLYPALAWFYHTEYRGQAIRVARLLQPINEGGFHLWTPDVYQGAPAPVSTFLATASKIAIFGVVMRLFLYMPVGNSEAVRVVLGLIAFASIIFGNLMALSQTNIKRLLGYSSISHLGYLLVALIALQSGEMSMEAVGVYLAGYLFSSLGAFGVVSLMSSPYRGPDADSLFSYRGLFWHRPILSAVMTVMMLSLAGIPMTLGFIGKFYVLAVGVHAHLWWLVAAVVVGSAIGLYYYLRVAVSLYLSAPEQLNRDAPSNWQYSAGGIVVLISALLVLVLGIWPQPLISIVQLATPLM